MCAICHDQMIPNKDVGVLECGHKFHDKCLENGSIPLNLLEKNINTWLEQKR